MRIQEIFGLGCLVLVTPCSGTKLTGAVAPRRCSPHAKKGLLPPIGYVLKPSEVPYTTDANSIEIRTMTEALPSSIATISPYEHILSDTMPIFEPTSVEVRYIAHPSAFIPNPEPSSAINANKVPGAVSTGQVEPSLATMDYDLPNFSALSYDLSNFATMSYNLPNIATGYYNKPIPTEMEHKKPITAFVDYSVESSATLKHTELPTLARSYPIPTYVAPSLYYPEKSSKSYHRPSSIHQPSFQPYASTVGAQPYQTRAYYFSKSTDQNHSSSLYSLASATESYSSLRSASNPKAVLQSAAKNPTTQLNDSESTAYRQFRYTTVLSMLPLSFLLSVFLAY